MYHARRFLLVLCISASIYISFHLGCYGQLLAKDDAAQVSQLRRRTDKVQGSANAGPSHEGTSSLSEIDEVPNDGSSSSRPGLRAGSSSQHAGGLHEDVLADAQAVDASRIQRLERLNPQSAEYFERYGETPFFNNAPIFERNRVAIFVLEQAIRDHGAVYVVSPDGQSLVKYATGKAQKTAVDDAHVFWEFYNMGPQINHLYKVMTGLPAVAPTLHGSNYDHVPHWGSTPIFHHGEADVAQTMKAINHPDGFLFMSPGTRNLRAYKFTVENDLFGFKRVENPDVESAIRKSFRHAQASVATYGPVLSSVLHGRPLQLESSSTSLDAKSLADIPRFDSHATRQQIVEALESQGKIRYYSDKNQWEVKLKELGELQVRKLSILDKTTEQISQRLGKLRIPH